MRALAVVGVGLIGTLWSGLVGAPGAAAATPKKPPAVVSLVASPLQLPAEGGSVRVTVRVRNATTCTFRKEQVAIASLRCGSGTATRVVRIAANPAQRTITLHFDVRVVGRNGTARKAVSVVQAAAPAPLAVTTTALAGAALNTGYSTTLSATGGRSPYTWTLTTGSLPSGLTLAAGGTIGGTPTSSGSFPVTLQVTDGAGRTATASLTLTVAAPRLQVGQMATSSNWSGYTLDGGSFTFVTGTFTVPSVSSTSTGTSTAEWVGIDGSGNQNLIQAGVSEDTQFCGAPACAWWEILPASATRIDTISVSAGDTVTVTISQVAAGSWTIQLVDVTNNKSFTTTQSYAGQGLSAEWIIEAASDDSHNVFPIGQYSPPVTFTGIGWSGNPSGWTPIQLRQGGTVLSVPSSFNSSQTAFAVAYGSTAPPAPS